MCRNGLLNYLFSSMLLPFHVALDNVDVVSTMIFLLNEISSPADGTLADSTKKTWEGKSVKLYAISPLSHSFFK